MKVNSYIVQFTLSITFVRGLVFACANTIASVLMVALHHASDLMSTAKHHDEYDDTRIDRKQTCNNFITDQCVDAEDASDVVDNNRSMLIVLISMSML